MNNFEMPVMELVSFSVDDIIRTSEGGGSGANGFSIGNNYKKAGHVDMGSDASNITKAWSEAISTNMGA